MNICFLQVSSPEIESYTQYSIPINKQYCLHHGYTYKEVPVVYQDEYAPQWSKIFQIRDELLKNEFTHIFFLDADAVVLNQEITLESKIEKMTTPFAMSINDWNGGDYLNTGALLCTTDALPYLEQCIRISETDHTRYKKDHWHEQTIINMMYDQGWKMDAWPMNEINSYWLHDVDLDPLQFVYHFMARPLAEKTNIAAQLYTKLITKE
jgi:hypothetical protein